MSHVKPPAPIVLATVADNRDGFLDTCIRPRTGGVQVVEPSQHVIVPQRRKGETRPRWVDDVAGRQPPEQPTFEEIFLAASARVRRGRVGAERSLESEQPFEHADRRVKR